MGMFSYDQLEQVSKTIGNNEDRKKVGYFNSLKNDGDEAIVRFVYSSPAQFDLAVVHSVKVGDFNRYVSCLRNGTEDISKCPLCARGDKLATRFFIKMLEYVKDETGKIIPRAVVWDRPVKLADTLKDLIVEFGDLSNMVCKIKRRGAKGDTRTSYDILPANQNVYKEEFYPKDFSAFEDFDLSHHSFYELDYNDMASFVRTGEIPQKENNTNNTNVNQSVGGQPGVQTYAQQPNGVAQAQQQMQFAENNPFAQQAQQPQPGFTGSNVQGVNPPYQPPFGAGYMGQPNQSPFGANGGLNNVMNQGTNQGFNPNNYYQGGVGQATQMPQTPQNGVSQQPKNKYDYLGNNL